MRAAERESTEDCPVKMKLVAPPLYVLNTTTLDKDQVRPVCLCVILWDIFQKPDVEVASDQQLRNMAKTAAEKIHGTICLLVSRE